jgi:hypothetical protein
MILPHFQEYGFFVNLFQEISIIFFFLHAYYAKPFSKLCVVKRGSYNNPILDPPNFFQIFFFHFSSKKKEEEENPKKKKFKIQKYIFLMSIVFFPHQNQVL